jgi:hypothetical protein
LTYEVVGPVVEMFSVWRVLERLVREKTNTSYWGVRVGWTGIVVAKSTGGLPSTERFTLFRAGPCLKFAMMKNT